MLRFGIHLLTYGLLAFFVCAITVAALAFWWPLRNSSAGKRAAVLALAVFGFVALLLGAKVARRLVHELRAERARPAAHVSTPQPATPQPDGDFFFATPRPNLPNPPPRPPVR